MRIGSLRKMIGFEYKGQVAYITRVDDFRDYMEPEVYEAVRKAFENGFDGGLRQEYEELQAEYDELQTAYDILKMRWETLMPSKLNGKNAKRSGMRYRKK